MAATKGSTNWDDYGLGWPKVKIDREWRKYTVTFKANATAHDARIRFLLGETSGSVWLDEVQLTEHPPDVFRREFTNGLVVLNATRQTQTIPIGPGYRRLLGNQAPRYQIIVDDSELGFSTKGSWALRSYDSGLWQVAGPFYHDWGPSCREGTGEAQWQLSLPESDVYTVAAWWPAAPQSAGWSSQAVFQILSRGEVVAQAFFDQRTGGDQWHLVGSVALSPEDLPTVRLVCPPGPPCLADALHVWSQARFNDGEPVEEVTLQFLDGIILERMAPLRSPRKKLRPGS